MNKPINSRYLRANFLLLLLSFSSLLTERIIAIVKLLLVTKRHPFFSSAVNMDVLSKIVNCLSSLDIRVFKQQLKNKIFQ